MGLESLATPKAKSVMGIDCSTKSIAFAIFYDKTPVRAGEIFFEGANLYERLADAHDKIPLLVKEGIMVADAVAFESAITVGNNHRTAISLAYVYGSCMGALMKAGMQVENVPPITWQSYIGNPNLKPAERIQLKKDNPGKSDNWYKNAGRELRKQRTLAWAKQYFTIPSESDNIGDAVGLAWYAANHLTLKK